MRLVVAVLVLGFAVRTAAADVPPIDAAITSAAAANKRLVVALGAQWCGPCRFFERAVLPDPRVVAELKNVVFVSYDVDTSIGGAVATRYGATGFPTFLVLDSRGSPTFRAQGLPAGAAAVAWFVELLRTGKARPSRLAQLRAAVANDPSDVTARLQLADALRELGQATEALGEYRTALERAGDPRQIAEARAAIDEIEVARQRLDELHERAVAFVEQHPASPITSQRLALIVALGRMPRLQLSSAIVRHLEAVRPADRPDAVRVAVLAGYPEHARFVLASWPDGDRRQIQLIHAELALAAGKRAEAARLVTAVCRGTHDLAAWCHELETALRSAARIAPGVQRLRDRAAAIVDDVRWPGRRAQHGSLRDLEPAVANAIAHAIRTADRECAALAGPTSRVLLTIALAPDGGRPRQVDIEPRTNAALARCMSRRLSVASLPASRVAGDPHIHVAHHFATAQALSPSAHLDSPRIDPGLALVAASRSGGLDTKGIAIDTLFDLTGVTGLRLTASAQVEAGISVHTGDRAYAARALLGFGYVPWRGAVINLGAGIGASSYGDAAPAALEIPFELRLRARAWRSGFGHLWVRGCFVGGERTRSVGSAVLGADEVQLGAAASWRLGELRVLYGGAFEWRAVGTTTLLMIGLPIGGYF